MTQDKLESLAARAEQADKYAAAPINIEVIEIFGFEQRRYPRAGWKFIYPDNGRPGTALWPTRCLKDLLSLLYWAKIEPPEMIYSDPRKAVAQVLRARAQAAT